ncbi:MAG: ankyrin repeat domain-containing protein, partial [Elusimicrobia bacterium]|nr:ankyrin repeat domain-containing protein [Elusimicrobiota bacterium]
ALERARAGAQESAPVAEKRADANQAGRKLFQLANTKGSVKEMGSALGDGASVDAVDDRTPEGPRYLTGDSETPLLVATRHNYGEQAKFLLEQKASAKASDRFGHTALMHAAYHGNTELIEALVKKGAEANAVAKAGWTRGGSGGTTAGGTALLRAIFKNRAQAADLLLRSGADVNLADADGRTPILWAYELAELEGAGDYSVLLATIAPRGPAAINARGPDGQTALLRYTSTRRASLVKALLAAPNLEVNGDGLADRPALVEAAGRGYAEIVSMLLASPRIDVNVRVFPGLDDSTALMAAARAGSLGVVKLLLGAKGIDPNLHGYNGTALNEAVEAGARTVVGELLKATGIDVNSRGASQRTPLIQAAERRDADLIGALLAAPGVDVNARANGGTTALHAAAQRGFAAGVNRLVAAPGIDVNAVDGLGATPLQLARASGSAETVGILVLAGAR